MTIRHHVGRLDALPDREGIRVRLGGHTVAIFQRDGRVHAVSDSCPHMGASLSEGYLSGCTVVCPWHGWAFDLDDGSSPFDPDVSVSVYRVEVEGGEVYVEIEEAAEAHTGTCGEEGGRGAA